MENSVVQQGCDNTLLPFAKDFEQVYTLIMVHKKRAMTTLHNESMLMVWQVGGYVSNRLKTATWGDSVVRMLSEYIRTRNPKAKGWSYRTIYKMVQLYETYSTSEFNQLVSHYGMQQYLQPRPESESQQFVPIELAQIQEKDFMGSSQLGSALICTRFQAAE